MAKPKRRKKAVRRDPRSRSLFDFTVSRPVDRLKKPVNRLLRSERARWGKSGGRKRFDTLSPERREEISRDGGNTVLRRYGREYFVHIRSLPRKKFRTRKAYTN